ncbi:DUF2059 domain-containing protein [Eikenella corrodens]|jgi:hypothetical protein|uniref:DUF2059 domain-containing protein n=1 Tax=Eikenella corrodens CC92I TaxID=1073362 RepID=V7IFE9_EIKCO|nr:DUF2059 domain-containing protein [Eikenella corrodens]ETA84608.1 hypothetical protein HMPREF1177_00260 [Eikenella corrodens CC92I]
MPHSLRRSIFRSLALAALLIALPADAQTPSDKSLNRLIELQNLPAQLRTAIPAATDFTNQEINRQINSNTRLSPEQRAALQRASEQYVSGMNREVFQSEELLNQMREISRDAMRQTYTQEEVDAMIAFYHTPVGQSVLNKQGDLTKTMMPPMMCLISQRYEQVSQRLTPQFRREVDRIRREAGRTEPPRHSGRGKRR